MKTYLVFPPITGIPEKLKSKGKGKAIMDYIKMVRKVDKITHDTWARSICQGDLHSVLRHNTCWGKKIHGRQRGRQALSV